MLRKILYSLPIIVIAIAVTVFFLANREAKIQADRMISQALASGSYQALSHESVKVDLFNGELTLNNLSVVDLQGTEYILNQVLVSDYDYLHEIPYHLNISASGISLPRGLPTISTGNSAAFERYMASLLVEENIPVTLDYRYNFEPENNNLITNQVSIGLEDAANLSFTSSIKNIPLEAFLSNNVSDPESVQTQLMTQVFQAEIPEVSLSIQDLGIVDTLVALEAGQSGVSSADIRQQLISSAQSLYLLAPPPAQQIAQDVSQELASFLSGNKTLRISIEPEYEGSIQRLQPEIIGAVFTGDYGAIFELLNLQVSTQ
jgi:hypothetical protein